MARIVADKVEPLSEPDAKDTIAEDVSIPAKMLRDTVTLKDIAAKDILYVLRTKDQ